MRLTAEERRRLRNSDADSFGRHTMIQLLDDLDASETARAALREALKAVESYMSLLYFRGRTRLPLGEVGFPSEDDINRAMGQARAALAKDRELGGG